MNDNEDELLLPFEKKVLQRDFRSYFSDKRSNFHATIGNFPLIWDCFSLLDQIWCREFKDTERPADESQIVPAMLYRDAHARFRIATELAFSCCVNEAVNALRFGIEAVYHACKLLQDPRLSAETARVWLESANDDRASQKAFRETFDDGKRDSFEKCGLGKLHEYWCNFSNLSHSNMKAMAVRLISSSPDSLEIHYFLTDPRAIGGSIFWILLASCEMEQSFFTRFEGRLRFDPELPDMRSRLATNKEIAREDLKRRFKLQPPSTTD